MYNINNFTNHSAILFETRKINYNRINNNNQMESIIIIKRIGIPPYPHCIRLHLSLTPIPALQPKPPTFFTPHFSLPASYFTLSPSLLISYPYLPLP